MKHETTETAPATQPEVKKWQADPSNPPGPIQVNRFNKAWRNLCSEHHTSTRKTGIIGKTDGYNAESCFTTVQFAICGDNAKRPDVTAAQVQIGERYGWTVTKKNVNQVLADIEAAMPALEAGRAVEDERQTQEQADAAKVQQAADNQASQARDEARAKAERDVTETAFGVPGRTVHLSPGEKAICAVLCFDNSHYQSDYFDTHATLGVPLLIGTTRGNREDEATARAAVARFAQLAALKFEWKTEKYSMGHGNYLTSEGVDVPETLGALRTPYGGSGPIKRGHWEIVYNHWKARDGGEMSVFAGFYDTPATLVARADAALEQGGALGTVAHNLEHNGVEIAFAEKPDDTLRWALKRAGFRITRRPPWKWYQKYSESAWAKACELAGCNAPLPASASEADPAGGYVQAQEDAYQDAQAAAIGA